MRLALCAYDMAAHRGYLPARRVAEDLAKTIVALRPSRVIAAGTGGLILSLALRRVAVASFVDDIETLGSTVPIHMREAEGVRVVNLYLAGDPVLESPSVVEALRRGDGNVVIHASVGSGCGILDGRRRFRVFGRSPGDVLESYTSLLSTEAHAP